MDEVRRMSEEKDNPVILAFARECAGREDGSVWEALQWLTAARDNMTRSMEAWRDLCRQREIQLGIPQTQTGDGIMPKL